MGIEKLVENKLANFIVIIISLIVIIITVFQIVGLSSPELISAADNVSFSGLPLSPIYGSTGALYTVLMISIFIALISIIFAVSGRFF